jgi:hypothetical protein
MFFRRVEATKQYFIHVIQKSFAIFIIFLIQNWMILQGTFAPRSHSAGSGRAAFTLLPLWSPMSLPAAESARVVETGGNCGAVGGHRSCRCGWWCEGILAVESVESWKWGKLMDEVATVWGRFAAAGSVGLGPRHLPWRWEWPRIWPSGDARKLPGFSRSWRIPQIKKADIGLQ